MTTNRPCGAALSSEMLEQQLRLLEQKIVRGEADSDAIETFIVYQLERQRILHQTSNEQDPAQSS